MVDVVVLEVEREALIKGADGAAQATGSCPAGEVWPLTPARLEPGQVRRSVDRRLVWAAPIHVADIVAGDDEQLLPSALARLGELPPGQRLSQVPPRVGLKHDVVVADDGYVKAFLVKQAIESVVPRPSQTPSSDRIVYNKHTLPNWDRMER